VTNNNIAIPLTNNQSSNAPPPSEEKPSTAQPPPTTATTSRPPTSYQLCDDVPVDLHGCGDFMKETKLEETKEAVTGIGLDPPVAVSTRVWRPLLLIIPLALGLRSTNPVYFHSIKVSLVFRVFLELALRLK